MIFFNIILPNQCNYSFYKLKELKGQISCPYVSTNEVIKISQELDRYIILAKQQLLDK